jgi:AraC-like DNA-binding protein
VDYITKPFDAEQLLLKIHNTLTRQHRLVAGNAKNATTSLQPKYVFSPQDQHFAAKLNTIIAEQYTNSNFTLGGIVSELGMSDRQLQRKIKALFDQTPAEYLRHYRVFTAQKMLLEGQQITQVAYLCGFKSPNYFSTCFKRVFGVSPTEFINQQD